MKKTDSIVTFKNLKIKNKKGKEEKIGKMSNVRTCEEDEESVFFGSAQLTVGALSPSLNFGLDIFCREYSAHALL